MAAIDRADAAHDGLQRALSIIEDKVTGRPLDLDVDLPELALITSALAEIGGSLVQSFNRPHAEIIEKLRVLALLAVDQ
jgi:hypothetical protein